MCWDSCTEVGSGNPGPMEIPGKGWDGTLKVRLWHEELAPLLLAALGGDHGFRRVRAPIEGLGQGPGALTEWPVGQLGRAAEPAFCAVPQTAGGPAQEGPPRRPAPG